ncbi:MAG: hydrophobe/amphiphile efflux-1 family RND transporter [Planctomycetaceae bacterium]|nr:hydrophobe/amphiphile efflux-1 family RND transporter [Planctomycetaceae bacterium]
MSRFFIHRPIFATVVSLVIIIAGSVAQVSLPVAKFPEITPPTVQVTCFYPGANPEVIAETVAAPIEQEVNGVEGMIYMNSVSSDDGAYALTVTFEIGTDMDMATVLVQNRVAIAEPRLPEEVRRQGITTKKQSTSVIQYLALTSSKPEHDAKFLSNFATLRLKDELARIEGVGSVSIFGADDYSMRVWLDPALLKARSLTTEDVLAAISEQNVQVAAGRLGEEPAPNGTPFQLTVNTQGRLRTKEQFGELIIRAEGQRFVRVKDVARVELGAKTYNRSSTFNGQPAATIAVYQLPGANALDVAQAVKQAMERLSPGFDEGIEYHIPFDTTRFVEASVTEVYKTLAVAVVLVVVVIFVFLQDWRATLIPCVAIPVSLIGAFAVMAALGFSINMLTLFGIVLAIGIVVDDAIVVVENTAVHLDKGLPPKEAAERAMDEITGPVIATTLVLLAVFVPTAFMGGITGQLYRQFALTISAAVVISSINALTLSPALCGILLRKTESRGRFFGAFNKGFDWATSAYASGARRLVRTVAIVVIVYGGLVTLAGWSLNRLPTGFIPTEDQGYVLVNVQLPDAASLQRTEAVMRQLDDVISNTPGVADWVSITGFSILSSANGSNAGMIAVVFEPWEERTDDAQQQDAIVAHLQQQFSHLQDAIVFAFIPPAIDGLGAAGGFQMQVQDRRSVGLAELGGATAALMDEAAGQQGIAGLNTTFRASAPQIFADIDRTKVKTLGVPLTSVFNTMQAYLGSAYVNDFNAFGRTYQVRVQADAPFRVTSRDIRQLDVRNAAGDMVPLGTFVDVRETVGPQVLQRFNLYPTAQVNGGPAPGFSSGQAMRLMEAAAEEALPEGMGYEWAGMSYQEKKLMEAESVVESQGFTLALSIVLVFLVLAAQYESWTSPAAVIAVVPLAALGVVGMLMFRGADNNVYTQIGLVLLVALASKNAILIVEFAAEQRRQGVELREAAVKAAQLRFRAILMTAFSSILGFLPLLVSSGAGAASRQAVGNAVVGGMAAATVFSLALTPVFFVIFRGLGERAKRTAAPTG